jgi:hypothetical protein
MADAFKILGQADLAATTLTDVYTVPAATEAVISAIVICERAGTATTFRVALAPNGAANANSHYLYYDTDIPANETFIASIGATIDATDVVRVYAGTGDITATVLGMEIT